MRRVTAVLVVLGLAAVPACTDPRRERAEDAARLTGGDPDRGREAIRRYGCLACHTIPGLPGDANVGPDLDRVGTRVYLGGVLVNTPENMARWLKDPPAVDPKTAMPNVGLTDDDLRDVACYLYTLRRRMRRPGLPLVIAAALLAGPGCFRAPPEAPEPPAARLRLPVPAADRGPPALLSQTGAFADTARLAPAAGLVAYDVNVPFWSDGAAKRRWVAVPPGGPVRFAPTGEWAFPAGTAFVKHFERDGRRLETRLLVRDAAGGVSGVAYRWRPDQADAEVVTAGRRAGEWYFPGPEDCRKCHTPAAGGVLGVNTRQLNRDGPGSRENQLVAWSRLGLLDLPVDAGTAATLPRLIADGPPEAAARSYLDANCGYCHRPGGAAADFDARYDTPLSQQRLVDAPARINLGLDRARQVAPHDPWRSMVLVRAGLCGDTGMPPLAHETVDRKGLAVLRGWVESLPGPPVAAPPALEPRGGDFPGPVVVRLRHDDPAAVVRYTLDGSPPGPTSPEYTGPLRLGHSATIRARAFKPGHARSVVVQDTFVIGH